MLYVSHEVDGSEVDLPVLVKRGSAGTTTLAENVEALPTERYRVEKYLIADPADVDGDCVDDITELGDPVGMNPVNPAPAIAHNDGAVAVPDLETAVALSYIHGGEWYIKFVLVDTDTDTPGVYFINTNTHNSHQSFLDAAGLQWDDVITGTWCIARTSLLVKAAWESTISCCGREDPPSASNHASMPCSPPPCR